MQHHTVQLVDREQPMASHRAVLRRHGFEGPPRQVPGEDDVDDVFRREGSNRRDRVHDRNRPLHRNVVVDADFLRQLTVQCVHEALARVDAPAGQEPVLAARLLMPAEQHPAAPAQNCRDANPGFHQTADEPNPRTPRSLSGRASTSSSSNSGRGTMTSCAMRIPRSTANVSAVSVFRRITRSSPR